jgi:hypothetical protein
MSIKRGVRLKGLVPQMVLAHYVVGECFARHGLPAFITSVNDGTHSATSLHHGKAGKYTDGLCRAIDYRTKYPELDGREETFRSEVKAALGDDFDVVIEDIGTENEHLHVEWDPKEA